MPFKLSDLRSDFTLTLAYLNLAFNNLAQMFASLIPLGVSLQFQPEVNLRL